MTIYESAPEIGEVGAGIQARFAMLTGVRACKLTGLCTHQVAPNFCRVLTHFGILERLKKQAVRLERASVRRYVNDEQLNTTSFANLENEYGYPTFVVHRGDLHRALLERALELGAKLETNVRYFSATRTRLIF